MSASKSENKIIYMPLDANFFFERAMRHLHRNNPSKALKYFRRTVDIEPYNPVHYCNIAGLLAEMGRFKESNELLLYVVEKLDPTFTECYYFLANNFAYLEDIESSYKYIHRYLEVAPQGEYANEANEMLSYISDEIEDMDDQEDEQEKRLSLAHYKARILLEEGKFYEAVKKLKEMVEENPDFLAARNNLALAYFYIGNHLQAIEQTKTVIQKDETNIHALCNLVVFYKQMNDQVELNYLLDVLRKILPFQKEHRYKLATTFAILGEHEMAFQHLKQIAHHDGVYDAALLHYGAVAAFNTGRYEIAEGKWKKILKSDSDDMIARYYLDITPQFRDGAFQLPIFCYQYQLPFEEQVDLLHMQKENKQEPFIFSSFLWALEHGDEKIKEQVLSGLALFQNSKAEEVLRYFLQQNQESYFLKKKALVALEQMNAKPPYMMMLNGKMLEMDRRTPEISLWKNNWIEVLELVDRYMGNHYHVIELYDAKTLWYEFISQTFPNTPQIRKAEGWVAALEYIVAKMHQRPISIHRLTSKYKVSNQTIMKHLTDRKSVV